MIKIYYYYSTMHICKGLGKKIVNQNSKSIINFKNDYIYSLKDLYICVYG